MSDEKLLELVDKITRLQFEEEYEVFLFEKNDLIRNLNTEAPQPGLGSNFNPEIIRTAGTVLGYVATASGTLALIKEAMENFKKSKENLEKLIDWVWKDNKEKEKKIKKRWKELLILSGMEPEKADIVVNMFYDDIESQF